MQVKMNIKQLSVFYGHTKANSQVTYWPCLWRSMLRSGRGPTWKFFFFGLTACVFVCDWQRAIIGFDLGAFPHVLCILPLARAWLDFIGVTNSITHCPLSITHKHTGIGLCANLSFCTQVVFLTKIWNLCSELCINYEAMIMNMKQNYTQQNLTLSSYVTREIISSD